MYEVFLPARKSDEEAPTVYIYTLSDPRDGAIWYCGRTFNPVQRLRIHIAESAPDRWGANRQFVSLRNIWIHELRLLGLFPRMFVVEEVETPKGQEAETRWIARLRAEGSPLTNIRQPYPMAMRYSAHR
jgi:hypothetical protein